MSEGFTIKKATRQGVIPLIGVYAESGCGKTMTSLLLARGIVGPKGKIVMIDSESRRGSLYADVIGGGFDVIDLDAPFSPSRYLAAHQAAINGGADIIVTDSMSHEHEGIGGVLDMAAQNEEQSGKSGLHNWKTPKLEHSKLVQFLLRSPVPVIFCIRAKYKTRQKKENGKTIIVKDEFTSPIQAEDFIYEMTAHFEVLPDHSINLTKCSHPSLKTCFPEKGPVTVKHGELIAQWCLAAGNPTVSQPVKPSGDLNAKKKELWNLVKEKCSNDATKLQQLLIDECILYPDQQLTEMTADQLTVLIAAVKSKFSL